ncbi:hypothetical protein ACUUL3_14820 [Thiovibrio sp. JS02]
MRKNEQNLILPPQDETLRKRARKIRERHRKERPKLAGRSNLFSSADFVFPEDLSHCVCLAGKRLYRNGNNVAVRNFLATKFKGPESACLPCTLRTQCLRHPERTRIRQVAYFHGRSAKGKVNIQWNLFCIVRNLKKVARYGPNMA